MSSSSSSNRFAPATGTCGVISGSKTDICVFDLDPSKDDEPDVLRAAAPGVRDLLAELGLTSWVKTSRSKGFHIVVPLDGKAGFGDVARFANRVAKILIERNPDTLT